MAQPENTTPPVLSAAVMIQGFQFKPATVVIKKGGSVTFTNQDTTPHTASADQKTPFVSTGRLLKDAPKTITFEKVGNYGYFCAIHPSMQGQIQVVE